MDKEKKPDIMYQYMAKWEEKNAIKNEDFKIAMELGFMEGWKKSLEQQSSDAVQFSEWVNKEISIGHDNADNCKVYLYKGILYRDLNKLYEIFKNQNK